MERWRLVGFGWVVLTALTQFVTLSLAGYYQVKQYPPKNPSGGEIAYTDYSGAYYGNYGASKDQEPGFVTLSGTITTVYEWVRDQIPDPNNPNQTIDDPLDNPPSEVISRETCTITIGATYFLGGGASGSVSNGLQFEPTYSTQPMYMWMDETPVLIGYGYTGVSIGTLYKRREGGETIPLECTPAGQITVTSGMCSASVSYSSQIIVPTVGLLGTTRFYEPEHAIKFLTGQRVLATVSLSSGQGPIPQGIPALTIDPDSYEWSFEDSEDAWDSFKEYHHTNTLGRLDRLNSVDKDDPAFNFYTNMNGTTRLKADFGFVVPEGARFEGGPQENPLGFTSFSKEVSSVRPEFVDWRINDGTVELQTNANRFVFAGDSDSTHGQQWFDVEYNVPGGFGQVGEGAFCQLITADRNLHRTVTLGAPQGTPLQFVKDPWNALQAVDTGLPYLSIGWNLPNKGTGVDSPSQLLTYAPPPYTQQWYLSTASDTFESWAMYRPPAKDNQPTTWIPMGYYTWYWGGTATLGQNGWALSNSTGGNNYGGVGVLTIDHPTWTRYSPSPFQYKPF